MEPSPPPEDLASRCLELRDRLLPRLPGIDEGDLLLILQSLLQPPGSGRRFFLRRIGFRSHVP